MERRKRGRRKRRRRRRRKRRRRRRRGEPVVSCKQILQTKPELLGIPT